MLPMVPGKSIELGGKGGKPPHPFSHLVLLLSPRLISSRLQAGRLTSDYMHFVCKMETISLPRVAGAII